MSAKVIVSYDGTDNDRDALALGKVLLDAGASLALAYVRHSQELEPDRETLAQSDAESLLEEGANSLGKPDLPKHVVLSASTGEGLSALAVDEGADIVVFGSEYRTPAGHLQPQATAQRMLEGGPVGVAIAPAGLHERGGYEVRALRAIGEVGDRSPLETASSLAEKLGAEVADSPTAEVDLLVVGSQPLAAPGRVAVTSAAQYLVETSRCPVLVLPRGKTVRF
ncbi:MAG: universal stress protein [Thermoleophilaceae bacterium]